jgi:putative transposase
MIISKNSKKILEDIMRDMKKFTSAKILEAIKTEHESRREWMIEIFEATGEVNSNNRVYQFWQQDNHPIECISPFILKQKMEYVHENPVRAGFVEKAEDWMYSSAGDYYTNRKGLVELSYV